MVTGAGPGGGPHVRIFSPAGAEKAGFFAYAPGFGGGVNVAVVPGQGSDPGMVLTAPAQQGGPHVRGFGPTGTPLTLSYFAYAPGMINGVTLAAIPVTGSSNNTNQNGSNNSSSG